VVSTRQKTTLAPANQYEGYPDFLDQLKARVQDAQIRAAQSVNRELMQLYRDIGLQLANKQEESRWGDDVIVQVSHDLRLAFPSTKGFSVRNLQYMRQFARVYSREQLELVGQVPWGHNQTLMNRLDSMGHRLWYAQNTLKHGWSRSVLEAHIDNNLYAREGKAITNFETTLPAPQSDLAQQATRDPYCFDFLTLRKDYIEKELEAGLAEHVRKTLMALGTGFAFLGNQFPIEVGENTYFMDLLFFHVKLNCFVVVELKTGTFQPEFAGKMNFYLSAVDNLMRGPDHKPTIGLFLCKDKGHPAVVEYSLQDIRKPMGVSSYTTSITDELPEDLESTLPSREELAARLDQEFLDGDQKTTQPSV